MNSQSWMLLWKECRERRTQFLICLLWMVLGTVNSLAYDGMSGFRTRTPVAHFFSATGLYALFVPIFLAMRTSLGEMTDRTRAFSDGLPISPGRRGWIRLVGGAGVLVAPIVVGALLLSACLALGWIEQVPTRSSQQSHYVPLLDRPSLSAWSAVGLAWQVAALDAWSGIALYLILSLLGTTLRSETHLGYAGAAIADLMVPGHATRPFASICSDRREFEAWTGARSRRSL